MSWRFQKLPLTITTVPDVDDMNENFYEIAEEIGGKLNEHNWTSGAFSSAVTNLALDSCFVYHSGANDLQTENCRADRLNALMIDIPQQASWREISSATKTFTSIGGLLWVHATAQINQIQYDLTPTTSNYSALFFAIQVNGYIIPETVVGGAEEDNDSHAGVFHATMPVGTSIVFPIPPGQVTVAMVVKTGSEEDGSGVYVNNAELICLEMRR